MRFNSISPKQAEIFKFPHQGYDALICDGAVRTGKTTLMTVSFILWAMSRFNGHNFAICGKTVQSAERNIVRPLLSLKSMTDRYAISYTRATHILTVRYRNQENYIHIFGGKDESSFMLVQGITLAGVLFDEVALMPRSFVEQARTRTLSIDNALLWFNCNPENPAHWFYTEWICKPEEHNAKHLHFLLEDNPGMSTKAIEKAKAGFTGAFYERYILGRWVVAEGAIYPLFNKKTHIFRDDNIPKSGQYYMSCDYGTINPFSLGLWCVSGGIAYRLKEIYHDSRLEGKQFTDEEYYCLVEQLAGGLPIQYIVVDPSAASFIQCIRRHGRFGVRLAINSVLDGIRYTGGFLQSGRLLLHESCKDSIREFGLYRWDEKSPVDKPIKENDHAMDDIRYFCATVLYGELRAYLPFEVKK